MPPANRTIAEIIQLIDAEKEWCQTQPFEERADQFRDGFIAGLDQAKRLVTQLDRGPYKPGEPDPDASEFDGAVPF
jgi:hypothetical protein